MADKGNLDTNLGDYVKLSLIMAEVSNLDENLQGYFELFFKIEKFG